MTFRDGPSCGQVRRLVQHGFVSYVKTRRKSIQAAATAAGVFSVCAGLIRFDRFLQIDLLYAGQLAQAIKHARWH